MIWRTQRQMVADIFAVYGRTAELSRTHMLYCLFRHAASHVLRDVAVRSGQRFVVQQLSCAGAHHSREQGRRGSCRSASSERRAAAGFRSPAPRQCPRTRTGTRCRSRRPRSGCSRRPARLKDVTLDASGSLNAMCGRYELHAHPAAIALAFGLALSARDPAALQHRAHAAGADRARQRRRASASWCRCAGDSCRAGRRTLRSARR